MQSEGKLFAPVEVTRLCGRFQLGQFAARSFRKIQEIGFLQSHPYRSNWPNGFARISAVSDDNLQEVVAEISETSNFLINCGRD